MEKIDPVEDLRRLAKELDVSDMSALVLGNWKFPVWSGSSKPHQHHYGKGGLAQHTWEVVTLCMQNARYFTNLGVEINKQQVYLAALFHDSGKMWDYIPTNDAQTEWTGAPHKRKVHHIARSALVWQSAVVEFGPLKWEADEVLHAILAHHLLREWGSPVQPQTHLAWLLHLCDNLSARMCDLGGEDFKSK